MAKRRRAYTKIIPPQLRKFITKKRVIITGAVIVAILVLIPLVTYAYFARDIADKERLMNRKNTGVVLVDKNGEEFYRAYGASSSNGSDVSLEEMPEHIPQALIANEDREFYEHGGYSVKAMLAALYGNILQTDLKHYGGSTITQQLAKNALLSHRKTYMRKYQELSLAIAIERSYSKEEILEMYLNSVYFGEGAFGIDDAADTYFGKSVKELTPAESSILIGILPGPSAMSPLSGDKEAAKENQEKVLTSMVEEDYITSEQKTKHLNQKLQFQTSEEDSDDFAVHYAQMVMEELTERYGEEKIARSGYRVTTPMDISWQEQAHNAVENQIRHIQSAGATNGALVAIDPQSGGLRALVGSADWDNEKFGKVNMATTPRQPGSSFKPVYYAEALRQEEITPATILKDEPTDFGGGYEPENFDFRYRGDITVRRALAQSLNIPSVKVMERLGVREATDAAQRMGLEDVNEPDTYGLSLALGTAEEDLLDMTNVYAAFANQGTQFEPVLIDEVQDKYGETIYTATPESDRVIGEGPSFLISSILSDAESRAPTFGGSLTIDRPAAVKTGTTEESKDAWTIGYTPNIAVGVWVGNNSNEAMDGIGGSTGAGPIWREAMQTFSANQQAKEFSKPASVESTLICRSNGLPAEEPFEGTYTEYFLPGTIPAGQCQAPEPEEEEDEEEEDQEEETQGEDTSSEEDTTEETEEETTDETEEDTQAPTVPENLSATSAGTDQIDLTWEASTDDTGVAGYYVYRDGDQIADVSNTSYSDTGLKPDTEYTYRVAAYDEAGNTSEKSKPASVKTDKE